jgi:mono/diheme cytochrome c family protein
MRPLFIAILATLICPPAVADDAPTVLKPGAGDTLTSANCNICHTMNYIVMNSMFLTQAGWQAEVTKMRSAFGAPIDDATAAEIIAYLAAHYAVPAKP